MSDSDDLQSTGRPFRYLSRLEALPSEDVANAVFDAVRQFKPEDPGLLIELLRSEHGGVRSRGLMVFSELGRKGLPQLDIAIECAKSGVDVDRANVLDAMLSYPKKLGVDHILYVLDVGSEDLEISRIRSMHLLCHIDGTRLKKGIDALGERGFQEGHQQGYSILRRPNTSIRELVEDYQSANDVVRLFIGAAILNAGSDGQTFEGVDKHELPSELKYLASFISDR